MLHKDHLAGKADWQQTQLTHCSCWMSRLMIPSVATAATHA